MCEECKKETTKVFVENLPRWRYGKGQPNGVVNWFECARLHIKVKFIYEGIEDELEIVEYDKRRLTIKYKELYTKIDTGGFCSGYIGTILGFRGSNFKLEVGTHLKDDKRDLIITDREYRTSSSQKYKYNEKWYKYTCNKCGWTEGWAIEGAIVTQSVGCGCCCSGSKRTVVGINDLNTTDSWVFTYLINKEDIYKYSYGSDKKILVKCPDCGREKKVSVSDLCKNHSIGCPCSDKISYPEKFFFELLRQLNIKYKYQLNKKTYEFNWCENKRYDFYFELHKEKYIIETHGLQHYKDSSNWGNVDIQIKNDIYKEQLAKNNGVKYYIQLDCRYSNLDYIKNSIINSEINIIFDLSKIDWLKCHEFACNNLIKIACNYRNKNTNITTREIGEIMNLTKETIGKYLKQGALLRWCEYNPKAESHRINILNSKKIGKRQEKKVIIYKDNIGIGVFDSLTELSNKSEELYGVNLNISKMSMVCRGKKPQYKGFTFKFAEDINNQESA